MFEQKDDDLESPAYIPTIFGERSVYDARTLWLLVRRYEAVKRSCKEQEEREAAEVLEESGNNDSEENIPIS